MPQNIPKNTGIGKTTDENMRKAIYDVCEGGLSQKAAALKYDISRTTFRRYFKKWNENKNNLDWTSNVLEEAPRLTPNYDINQFFFSTEKKELSNYLQTMTKLHHGLNPKGARQLAYDLAIANRKKNTNFVGRKQDGRKVLVYKFYEKNSELSLRSAEATSLGRAMEFNRLFVAIFFSNPKKIYEKYAFTPSQVYNVDETALTTMQDTRKVIAKKEQKQVGHIVSNKRVTLVTMCNAINAIGNSILPFLVFPRKFFKNYMVKNAPPVSHGCAAPSGWMTAELFEQWMIHFAKHTNPTKESHILLIMDNHESHVSLASIKFAKENNIILLTLRHILVFGYLKKYYSHGCQNWLLKNPGKRITIYDIAEILSDAYPLSVPKIWY
ncbi:uncharacterized protein [Diabrotica undecimpunctata]|uniref:uncharacterized protein n=1 Tax=Diabrotica undecimpunctata TaxID=50387 RepID=UPI003B639E5F